MISLVIWTRRPDKREHSFSTFTRRLTPVSMGSTPSASQASVPVSISRLLSVFKE